MKKYYITTVVLGLLISLTGCNSIGSKKNPTYAKEMDKVISEYIIDRNNRSDETSKAFEVHHVYGTKTTNHITTFYILSNFGVFRKGTDTMLSGYIVPAVVTIKKTDDTFKVSDYKEAKDGSMYVDSIKEMYPKKYENQVLNNVGKQELDKELMKQVHKFNGVK